jgi:hypothetical protein
MEPPADKRAADAADRELLTCDVCGAVTERGVDPTPYVPEFAAQLVNLTLCGWLCAYDACAAQVPPGRADLRAEIRARLAAHAARLD